MDVSLHYVEQGAGFPLLLLHGNGENSEYFIHQISFFSQQYRVIALDTRGHGSSPRGGRPFTIGQFAEDLHDFMEERGISRAHLLGFSDGGNIALRFALDYPEMVEKLILNGANLNPKGVKASVQLPIEVGFRIAALFAKHHPCARKKAELLGLMVQQPSIQPEELHHLQIKTLVLAGSNDMIKERHTKMIYENLPNGELAIIEGGHFIASENPEAFNRRVEAFLCQ